ncbi:zinc-binding alcohol dehydrogenase [Actinoplanes sp. NPDC049548]|uniref:zinc-binding alcohol dehydrogenase n=1 Tax=Actinoplanes sp. NPDC049548 TaxID=3155152 RepID=UPI00343BCB7F
MLIADGTHGLRAVPVQDRRPAAGQLLIATECSLISPGTELHYLDRGLRTGERHPLGYCAAGTVLEAGPAVPGFRPGDRVIAMGWGHAVHADRILVPYRLCRPVPRGVDLTDAVLANLAATAVHAADRSGLRRGDDVLVVGAGLIGQLVAQVAAERAAHVTLVDTRPDRLRSAAALGFTVHTAAALAAGELTGGAPPVGERRAFLCLSGEASESVTAAARWATAAGGRPVLVGVGRFRATVDFSVELGNLDVRYAARCGTGYRDDEYAHGRRDLDPPPGEATVETNLQRALDLIAAGWIRPARMALETMPVGDAECAYGLLRSRPDLVSVRFTYGGRL